MKTLCGIRVGDLRDRDPNTCGKVGLVDLPFPEMGEEDVKIKVAYCAICGSDPHCVNGSFGQPKGDTTPIPLGHEVSGVIVELGPKATRKGLKVGDRVGGNFLKYCGTCYYCQNGQQQFCENFGPPRPGMAPYLIWNEEQVYKLPDNVSLKEGCLLEPVSVVVRLMDKCQVQPGQRVAVCGGGPIGLLALQSLHLAGATSLTLIEPIAQRRELGRKMGAAHVIDPVNEAIVDKAMHITGGRGFDVVLDCSGSVHAVEALPLIASKCGRVVYGAMYPNNYNMPFNIARICYFNELTITGSFCSPYAFPRAVQWIERLDLRDFTNTVFDLDDGEQAFAAQMTGKYPKILIRCNSDLE